ncbi:hypothetical protein SUDANB150_01905 [Streptomyces sp. enrichment culture]
MSYGDLSENEALALCEDEWEPDPWDSLQTFGAVVQALREHAGFSRVEFGEADAGRVVVERAEEATGNSGRRGNRRGI